MEKFTVEIRPDKYEGNELRIYRFGTGGPCLCIGMTDAQLKKLQKGIEYFFEKKSLLGNELVSVKV